MNRLFLIWLLLVLNPFNSNAQRTTWRDGIDEVVRQADSLAFKSQKTFYALRYLNKEEAIKETWYYTLKEGRIAIFQLRYHLNDIEFNEVYYLHKGNLVCMEQYESPLKLSEEEIRRAEVYYFQGSAMMQYVQYGKMPKGYVQRPPPDYLAKFQKRYDELRRNMTLDPDYRER